MVVELQVNLADVDLVLVEQGELICPVGDLRDLEEGTAEDLLFLVDGLGVEVANDERAVCFVG